MRRKTRQMKQQQEGTVRCRIGQNSTKAFLDKVEKKPSVSLNLIWNIRQMML